jgi:hypothetical protein
LSALARKEKEKGNKEKIPFGGKKIRARAGPERPLKLSCSNNKEAYRILTTRP